MQLSNQVAVQYAQWSPNSSKDITAKHIQSFKNTKFLSSQIKGKQYLDHDNQSKNSGGYVLTFQMRILLAIPCLLSRKPHYKNTHRKPSAYCHYIVAVSFLWFQHKAIKVLNSLLTDFPTNGKQENKMCIWFGEKTRSSPLSHILKMYPFPTDELMTGTLMKQKHSINT